MEASTRVAQLARKVVDYIDSHPEVEQFFPQIAAKAINDTEAATMLGFYLLEKAGVAERHIAYFCEEHGLPLEPADQTCPACMEAKREEDESAYAETYFTVDRTSLSQLRRTAA